MTKQYGGFRSQFGGKNFWQQEEPNNFFRLLLVDDICLQLLKPIDERETN